MMNLKTFVTYPVSEYQDRSRILKKKTHFTELDWGGGGVNRERDVLKKYALGEGEGLSDRAGLKERGHLTE